MDGEETSASAVRIAIEPSRSGGAGIATPAGAIDIIDAIGATTVAKDVGSGGTDLGAGSRPVHALRAIERAWA